VIGAFNVLTLVLAVRLTLLVAVSGGIALAYLAVQSADPYRLGALLIYSLGVVGPVVWLAGKA
jgi:hypothetical protein